MVIPHGTADAFTQLAMAAVDRVVEDRRRAFVTAAIVSGADPDDLDAQLAQHAAAFEAWRREAEAHVRACFTEKVADGR